MDIRTPSPQAAVITPECAATIQAFGLYMKILLTTETTGGATSAILAWHEPGEGAPDHLHLSQDEIFFIVEGTYEVTVDGVTSTVGPGSLAFLPRNTVHCFRNVGNTRACMLDLTLPGGQDRYFKAISQLTGNRGFMGEQVLEISRKHDTYFPTDGGAMGSGSQSEAR